jgi:hypothetical protein
MWLPLFLPMLVGLAHLALVPLAGAALLLLAFRVTRLAPLTYFQSWKVYLAAVAYGLMASMLVGVLLGNTNVSGLERLVILAGAVCLAQLLSVALLLRRFSTRDLLAEGGAVVVTNLAVVPVIFLLSF